MHPRLAQVLLPQRVRGCLFDNVGFSVFVIALILGSDFICFFGHGRCESGRLLGLEFGSLSLFLSVNLIERGTVRSHHTLWRSWLFRTATERTG